MRLIGIDPGLANLGLAEVVLLGQWEVVKDVRVIQTELDRSCSRAEDASARARFLAGQLDGYIRAGERPLALCVEAIALPFGRVQHSVVSNLGRVRGLIDAIAELARLPVIEHTPQELKLHVAGLRDAEKAEVIGALERRYPYLREMWPRGGREHAADAVAAALVSRHHPLVARAVRYATVDEDAR